jgi:hypothetical protein
LWREEVIAATTEMTATTGSTGTIGKESNGRNSRAEG